MPHHAIRNAIAVFAIISLSSPAAAPYARAQNTVDTAAWLADLQQLKTAMSRHYANLEWVAHQRHTDLKELLADTVQALRAARTAADAQTAFERFLNAMGDGHLEIDWPEPEAAAATPTTLCNQLGYRERRLSPGIRFQDLPMARSMRSPSGRYFPQYVLRFPDGSAAGVIRIGVFSARWYPELCEAALARFHLTEASVCDDACADRVQIAAENELTRELTDGISVLQRIPRLRVLIIDLTANGGGTDWVEPAMREFTAVNLRSPRMGFIKHPHWQQEFQRRIAAIRHDLPLTSAGNRRLLMAAFATYTRLLRTAKMGCDQSPLWNDAPLHCSLVADGDLYTTGTLATAPREDLPATLASSQYIFSPSQYTYRDGVYRGPLAVLVDENTASAAERFAAVLQDNHAAQVVGAPTYGAGCGFTNGGIPTVLRHSGATVMMPDCVQFRADGTNAVAGVTPDVLVPWHATDNRYQRAQRVYQTLLRRYEPL